MDFVDRHRLTPRIGMLPMVLMPFVAPFMVKRRGDDRRGRGAQFGLKGKGVGLERQDDAIRAHNLILIRAARSDIGQENLPHASVRPVAHRRAAAIPAIEVAHHRHALCIGKMRAGHPVMGHCMRAQLVEQASVRPLREIIIIHRPQDRAEAIGIDHDMVAAVAIMGDVTQRLALADFHLAEKQPVRVDRRQFADRLAVQRLGADANRFGQQHTGGKAAFSRMHAKRGKGVVLATLYQPVNLFRRQHRLSSHSAHGFIFQMSAAYSRMVRSDENQPIRATLCIAFFAHKAPSVQSASTLRCAAE